MNLTTVKRCILFLIFLFSICNVTASSVPTTNLGKPWFTHSNVFNTKIYVDLYMSSNCPHCIQANYFFSELERQQRWIVVERHWVDKDITALKDLYRESALFDYSGGYVVPSIFFCQTHWVGFNEQSLSGKMLLKGLNTCFTSIFSTGEITPQALNQLQRWSQESRVLSHVDKQTSVSWSTLILQSAYLDAITPCAFFAFMVFFALLGISGSQRSRTAKVGGLFLLILGMIHCIQLLHWDLYTFWISNLASLARLCGLISVVWLGWFLWRKPKADKRFTSLYLLTALLAWSVYSFQQQCGFSFPVFYQYWMSSHQMSQFSIMASTLLYQFLYVSILGLMLGLILRYGFPKPTLFKNISWLALLGTSSVMSWNPNLLSSLLISWVLLLIIVIMGIIWTKFSK